MKKKIKLFIIFCICKKGMKNNVNIKAIVDNISFDRKIYLR